MEELKYSYKYPRPAVTTDCVIFGFDDDGLSVLLIQRGAEPYKDFWAFPGGFLNMDEDAESGARRELMEETGFIADTIVQFGAFSAVDRDPRGRVITIAFYALVKTGKVEGGDDAADARWFPINQIPALAFDHEDILNRSLCALRERLRFQPVGIDILPEEFSMSQLVHMYECIPGLVLDTESFSIQMLGMKLLSKVRDGGNTEPLYCFDEEVYSRLKTEGFRLDF